MKTKSNYTAINPGLLLFIICLAVIVTLKWMENNSINQLVNKNAGLLAAQILSTSDEELVQRLISYKEDLKKKVEETAREMES